MNLHYALFVLPLITVNMIAAKKCSPGNKIEPKETFEGSSSGWENAKLGHCDKVGSNYISGNFLGPYGKGDSKPHKTYEIPLTTSALTLDFDFYALASWDFAPYSPSDVLKIKLNDETIDLSANSAVGAVVGVTRGDLVEKDACFLDAYGDYIIHYALSIPASVFAETNTLKVKFLAAMDEAHSNEGAGFDNIVIRMVDCVIADPDQDGIKGALDLCPDTKLGAKRNSNGCSGAQMAAKTCRCQQKACRKSMKNGGTLYQQYWKCVSDQTKILKRQGLIDAAEKRTMISAAQVCQCPVAPTTRMLRASLESE